MRESYPQVNEKSRMVNRMTEIPQAAIDAAAEAVKARHAQITGNVIPYGEPEFRADLVTAVEAAAPHMAYAAGIAAGDRIQAAETRAAELDQLARDVLASFHASGGGHRARAGQVQIGKWRAVLDGDGDG